MSFDPLKLLPEKLQLPPGFEFYFSDPHYFPIQADAVRWISQYLARSTVCSTFDEVLLGLSRLDSGNSDIAQVTRKILHNRGAPIQVERFSNLPPRLKESIGLFQAARDLLLELSDSAGHLGTVVQKLASYFSDPLFFADINNLHIAMRHLSYLVEALSNHERVDVLQNLYKVLFVKSLPEPILQAAHTIKHPLLVSAEVKAQKGRSIPTPVFSELPPSQLVGLASAHLLVTGQMTIAPGRKNPYFCLDTKPRFPQSPRRVNDSSPALQMRELSRPRVAPHMA